MVSLNFIFNIIDFTKIDFTEVYNKYFFFQYVEQVGQEGHTLQAYLSSH
jgi:hypothetical protein